MAITRKKLEVKGQHYQIKEVDYVTEIHAKKTLQRKFNMRQIKKILSQASTMIVMTVKFWMK